MNTGTHHYGYSESNLPLLALRLHDQSASDCPLFYSPSAALALVFAHSGKQCITASGPSRTSVLLSPGPPALTMGSTISDLRLTVHGASNHNHRPSTPKVFQCPRCFLFFNCLKVVIRHLTPDPHAEQICIRFRSELSMHISDQAMHAALASPPLALLAPRVLYANLCPLEDILLSHVLPTACLWPCPYCELVLGCEQCLFIHLLARRQGCGRHVSPTPIAHNLFVPRLVLHSNFKVTHPSWKTMHATLLPDHEYFPDHIHQACPVHKSPRALRSLFRWSTLTNSLLLLRYRALSTTFQLLNLFDKLHPCHWTLCITILTPMLGPIPGLLQDFQEMASFKLTTRSSFSTRPKSCCSFTPFCSRVGNFLCIHSNRLFCKKHATFDHA